MSLLPKLWKALTRERTFRRRRSRSRTGRSARSGVALFLVISLTALLSVVVMELSYSAGVRIQMAANQRDEAKAEALAQAGLQFYRLFLLVSKQADPIIEQYRAMIAQYLPSAGGGVSLWQFIPAINSSLVSALLMTGGDADDATKELEDQAAQPGEAITTLKKGFLDFDGQFTASVKDENRKLYVGEMTPKTVPEMYQDVYASQVAGLMAGEDDFDFLRAIDYDRWELIGNLVDWVDRDDLQLFRGGRESALYEDLPTPYLPKNAKFDSQEELRLVDGWHLDEVWERYGQNLTIYGDGKVNVNTATRPIIGALIRSYVTPPPNDSTLKIMVDRIFEYRSIADPTTGAGGFFPTPQSFVQVLEMNAIGEVNPAIQQVVAVKSTVFRVTSEGVVGNASVSIEAVIDYSNSSIGKILYWRVK